MSRSASSVDPSMKRTVTRSRSSSKPATATMTSTPARSRARPAVRPTMPPPAMIVLVTVYTCRARADARLRSPDLPMNSWPDGSLVRHARCQRTAPPPRQSIRSMSCAHAARHARRRLSSPIRAEEPAELSGEVARVLGVADVATRELRYEAAEPPGERDNGQERHDTLL